MIKIDSRKVIEGDTFLALDNGHNYIEDAILNGATSVIAEYGDYPVDTLIVESTRNYLVNYLKESIDINKLKIIGITGTNGKTTSCYLTYQLLNLLGIKTAYIGTIGFYIDDKIKDLDNTTPDIYDLYLMFDECIKKNVSIVVMEVSSHSLALNRLDGIEFDIACFTNLTQDHLDFHKTMDNYKLEKLKLFNKLKEKSLTIVNSDSEYYESFIKDNTVTIGLNGDIKLLNYELYMNRSIFRIELDKIYEIELNIPGLYNIYNYLNAFVIANYFIKDIDKIIELTKILHSPKGRFEIIEKGNSYIIIDYAHTPDAVLNIITNIQKYALGKIITIIGCGGNRDKLKRPLMGDIATSNSDYVIFTNDNPRDEDETNIMNDITKDLECSNYEIEYNREVAIKKGINLLDELDILLILGKGHETYQIVKNKRQHFDDKEICFKYL